MATLVAITDAERLVKGWLASNEVLRVEGRLVLAVEDAGKVPAVLESEDDYRAAGAALADLEAERKNAEDWFRERSQPLHRLHRLVTGRSSSAVNPAKRIGESLKARLREWKRKAEAMRRKQEDERAFEAGAEPVRAAAEAYIPPGVTRERKRKVAVIEDMGAFLRGLLVGATPMEAVLGLRLEERDGEVGHAVSAFLDHGAVSGEAEKWPGVKVLELETTMANPHAGSVAKVAK